jgi:hypothetical protein
METDRGCRKALRSGVEKVRVRRTGIPVAQLVRKRAKRATIVSQKNLRPSPRLRSGLRQNRAGCGRCPNFRQKALTAKDAKDSQRTRRKARSEVRTLPGCDTSRGSPGSPRLARGRLFAAPKTLAQDDNQTPPLPTIPSPHEVLASEFHARLSRAKLSAIRNVLAHSPRTAHAPGTFSGPDKRATEPSRGSGCPSA